MYSTSGGPDLWRDGKDSAVRVWDVETGRELRKLEGHKGRVLTVDVSPDGKQVLTGGSDTRVILWDANNGNMIRRFDGHNGSVSRATFMPDGKRLVSSSFDKTIRLWDLKTGKMIHAFTGHPTEVLWFAVSSDGRQMLSSDFNAHELRLWDLNLRAQIDRIDLGKLSPTRGSISTGSRFAVWPATGGSLYVYELSAEPERAVARSVDPAKTHPPGPAK